MKRDFTYIDDISEALVRCCFKPAYLDPDFKTDNQKPNNNWDPFLIFNISNINPIDLMRFIVILKNVLFKSQLRNLGNRTW